MDREERIDVGDVVKAQIFSAQVTIVNNAEVCHVPCASGDSWVFKDAQTGSIHYVSEGCTVSLIKKKHLDDIGF